MPYVPRVASSRRRTEPKVAEDDLAEVRPDTAKLATPDIAKLATPDIAKSSPSADVVHPVEDNPAACPGPVCEGCFPDGVDLGTTSVGCAHGMWVFKSN